MLLGENTNCFGFVYIPQHICARLTTAGYQTITNDRYISWSYDLITNLIRNKYDTRMVVNRGVIASQSNDTIMDFAVKDKHLQNNKKQNSKSSTHVEYV